MQGSTVSVSSANDDQKDYKCLNIYCTSVQ